MVSEIKKTAYRLLSKKSFTKEAFQNTMARKGVDEAELKEIEEEISPYLLQEEDVSLLARLSMMRGKSALKVTQLIRKHYRYSLEKAKKCLPEDWKEIEQKVLQDRIAVDLAKGVSKEKVVMRYRRRGFELGMILECAMLGGTRKRDDVADVFHSGDVLDEPLEAEAETSMGGASEPA